MDWRKRKYDILRVCGLQRAQTDIKPYLDTYRLATCRKSFVGCECGCIAEDRSDLEKWKAKYLKLRLGDIETEEYYKDYVAEIRESHNDSLLKRFLRG